MPRSGEQIVIALTPSSIAPSAARGPFRVLAEDAAGNHLRADLFRRRPGWAKKLLPVGEKRWVAGRLDQYGQMLQIVHPDHVVEPSERRLGRCASRSIRCPKG